MTALDTEFRVGEHLVRFYEDDRDLGSVLSPHLARGLHAGDTAVVIATPTHRALITQDLVELGVDVASATEAGHLILLDAADTLERFIRRGAPDPDAFYASVGGVVRAASERGRPIHAFGEMVALLWQRGAVAAAIELERLWNRLAQDYEFSLVCAYPRHLTTQAGLAAAFDDLCSLHSRVIGGAPIPDHVDVCRRIAHTPHAPALARRFVAEQLLGDGQFDLIDGTRLAVSELVSNVIEHTDSDVTVGLRRTPTGVRVLVGDTSPGRPIRLPDAVHLAPGRGLRLVEVVADEWGFDEVAGGKIVWADLRPSY